jgi:hypothetical protein
LLSSCEGMLALSFSACGPVDTLAQLIAGWGPVGLRGELILNVNPIYCLCCVMIFECKDSGHNSKSGHNS